MMIFYYITIKKDNENKPLKNGTPEDILMFHFQFCRKMALFFMEKTLMGKQNVWDPFQQLPTNMLQLVIDYMQIMADGSSASDLIAFHEKHKDILQTGVGMEQIYATAGAAGNSTLRR